MLRNRNTGLKRTALITMGVVGASTPATPPLLVPPRVEGSPDDHALSRIALSRSASPTALAATSIQLGSGLRRRLPAGAVAVAYAFVAPMSYEESIIRRLTVGSSSEARSRTIRRRVLASAQYARKDPVEPLDDQRSVTSSYRRTRTVNRGRDGSIDTSYQVQAWGNGGGGIDAEWQMFNDVWKESILSGSFYNGEQAAGPWGGGWNQGGNWRWLWLDRRSAGATAVLVGAIPAGAAAAGMAAATGRVAAGTGQLVPRPRPPQKRPLAERQPCADADSRMSLTVQPRRGASRAAACRCRSANDRRRRRIGS